MHHHTELSLVSCRHKAVNCGIGTAKATALVTEKQDATCLVKTCNEFRVNKFDNGLIELRIGQAVVKYRLLPSVILLLTDSFVSVFCVSRCVNYTLLR